MLLLGKMAIFDQNRLFDNRDLSEASTDIRSKMKTV